jgi:hypothetical protein
MCNENGALRDRWCAFEVLVNQMELLRRLRLQIQSKLMEKRFGVTARLLVSFECHSRTKKAREKPLVRL